MVKKICTKLGQFIAYCLNIYEHTEEEPTKITPSLINEWLYGGGSNE